MSDVVTGAGGAAAAMPATATPSAAAPAAASKPASALRTAMAMKAAPGIVPAVMASKAAEAGGLPAAMAAKKMLGQDSGMIGKIISTTKTMLVSPFFGVAALCGIIGYELWKGSRDADDFE